MKIPKFPTMLRKMWSGGEVQKWMDAHLAEVERKANLYEHMLSVAQANGFNSITEAIPFASPDASPAAPTEHSYQTLFDAIAAATSVTAGTGHIAISVIAFRAALLAASPADHSGDSADMVAPARLRGGYAAAQKHLGEILAENARASRQGVALSDEQRKAIDVAACDFEARGFDNLPKMLRSILSRASSSRVQCTACGGNDGDVPCAFPGGSQPNCLRQVQPPFKRYEAMDEAARQSEADMRRLDTYLADTSQRAKKL
jgi:hypothetical protein